MPGGADHGSGDEGSEGAAPRAKLAALIDNRAGAVGLAVLDASGALLLSQQIETTRSHGIAL